MASTPPAGRIDFQRYRKLRRFVRQVFLHVPWWDVLLNAPWLRRFRRPGVERWAAIARRYRAPASEMGGVLIKIGQFFSVRVDLLPPEVTRELSGLQDEVPPVDFAEIICQITEGFGRPATVLVETDLAAEGRNAEHFARDFAGDDRVRIPRVHWEWTARRTLTLEDVGYLKIGDLAALERAGVSRSEVSTCSRSSPTTSSMPTRTRATCSSCRCRWATKARFNPATRCRSHRPDRAGPSRSSSSTSAWCRRGSAPAGRPE